MAAGIWTISRYLGERSAGHQDPGATSSYLLLKAAADAWSGAAVGDSAT
jgi:dihydroxyacetone kinase-like protein